MKKRILYLIVAGLMVSLAFLGCKKDDDNSSSNNDYTQSDLYGTWKGTFEGVSVTVVTTASNNWTLSSNLFSDYGTFTFTGSGGGLYSKQWNMNVGKWTFLSKTKITITLSSDTDYPGTYTLSKQ
jgi:hypothetical protein